MSQTHQDIVKNQSHQIQVIALLIKLLIVTPHQRNQVHTIQATCHAHIVLMIAQVVIVLMIAQVVIVLMIAADSQTTMTNWKR
jgi:hypothetical protein